MRVTLGENTLESETEGGERFVYEKQDKCTRRLAITLLIASALAMGYGSCGAFGNPCSCPLVVVPFPALTRMLDADVARGRVRVAALPGCDGEVTRRDVSRSDVDLLGNAGFYFSLGYGWEEALVERARAVNPRLEVHSLTNGCSVKEGNPYFWLSPGNGIRMGNRARGILEGRSDTVPDRSFFPLTGIQESESYTVLAFHRAFEYLVEPLGLKAIYVDLDRDSASVVREKVERAGRLGVNRAFMLRFQSVQGIEFLRRCRLVSIDPYGLDFLVDFVTEVVRGFVEFKDASDEASTQVR